MKIQPSLALLFLITFCIGRLTAQAPSMVSADGVSMELAHLRKKTLSNIRYNLNLNIPATKDEPIVGTETIDFDLSDTTPPLLIDFKAEAKQVQRISVNGKQAEVILQNEHLVISDNLEKGSNSIDIQFIAGQEALTRQPEFLYTFLVPNRARTFFPCFDQPDLKAHFTLRIAVPADWTAVTNGALKSTTVTSTSKIFTFSESDLISTYLFSIVAGKFQKETRSIDGREMNFYYRETDRSKIKQSLDTIFDIHRQSISFLEEYTGIPYPFKKLDFVAIPSFQAGGMEHVGATDYMEEMLFLGKTASAQQKTDRVHLIAHEMAHTWFGNLVTMEWFNDVWMKEVFANLMADKIIEHGGGKAGDLEFLLEHYPAAYAVDRTAGNHPIRQQLSNLNQASTMYGTIIYDKAPIVMHQLEKMLGAERFRDGIRQYLKTYANGNADWNDLITIFQNGNDDSVATWNDNWINKAGRPVFSYELTQSEGKITGFTIAQKAEHTDDALGAQKFMMALVYADRIESVAVDISEVTVAIEAVIGRSVPDYILFNAGGNGYGSFPVDVRMLPQIAKLKDDVMRASGYLNIYELMLTGDSITPRALLDFYQNNFAMEENLLLLERIKRQYRNTYWQFITADERTRISGIAEKKILAAIAGAKTESKKRSLLDLYNSIAISTEGVNLMYEFWKTKVGPQRLRLDLDDQNYLAAELALRNHPLTDKIFTTQYERISSPDKKARWQYLAAALSNDVKIRDAYFETLGTNRQHDDWIPIALGYLHHPLRQKVSEKYLLPTLNLLDGFHKTGSVFFANNCLSASFGSYQSAAAAAIVEAFLKEHPDYNPNLKKKILQECDDLFRAVRLLTP